MITQVTPSTWRGPRPTDLAPLQKMGIKRLINLEFFHRSEDQNPLDYGMVEIYLPCSDIMPPETCVFKHVLELEKENIPTLIHCQAGVDRTGIISAGLRMHVLNWSFDAAYLEWVKMGRPPGISGGSTNSNNGPKSKGVSYEFH